MNNNLGKPTSAQLRRQAALVGMIGPILFVATFTIEGLLRPGYNPLSMYISELSLGPRGWIQIVNFVVAGALLLIFARGLASEFPDGKSSRAGPVIMGIISLGILLSGLFVMDPPNTPLGSASLSGLLHGVLGGAVFTLMPVSCYVYLRRFREDRNWKAYSTWTLITFIIVTMAVLTLTIVTKQPSTLELYRGWLGLIQRAALIPYMAWVALIAYNLHRLEKS